MPSQTTTMAAPARAAQARVDGVSRCQQSEIFTPPISGWRAGLATAVVAAVLVLLAAPVFAVLTPAQVEGAAGWLERLAGIAPVMVAARALVFIVAAVVIARSDGRT